MQDEKLNDVTWLYDFALDWYSKNPGEQISLYDWQNKVEQANELSDPWVIYVGLNYIKPVSHNIIPALAAIEHGVDRETLLAIIKHHEVTTYHISQTVCAPIYDDYDAKNDESLSWIVSQELVNAIMLDKETGDNFVSEYTKYGVSYDMEMAWLQCNHAPFWPDTVISHHLQKIANGDLIKYKIPSLLSAYALEDCSVHLEEFSNDLILLMLKRSGNLRLGLTTENGFAVNNMNAFFRTLLTIEPKRNQNINKVLEAINTLQNKEMISLITAKITESLSERNAKLDVGTELFEAMNKLLNNDLYGSISKDLVLNLKLLAKVDMNASPETSMEGFFGNHLVANLGHAPGLALEQLLSEFKALMPEGFRRPHFEAIGILLSNCGEVDESTRTTCKHLLFVALDALDVYRVTPHYQTPNATSDVHVDAAKNGLEPLIRLVASSNDINYSNFNKYSSDSKALLASNGFDIKKLSGISRRDRGQMLCDGIGL